MKYLFLDTNIYLYMIADNRKKRITQEVLNDFRLLLETDRIKIILPEIVEYETYKHIDEIIKKVEKDTILLSSKIEDLHWFSDLNDGTLNVERIRTDALESVKQLTEDINRNKEKYTRKIKDGMENIFNHRNTIKIPTYDSILKSVCRRRIFKRAPFKDEKKDCYADAAILETMLHIEDFCSLESDDKIFFVTENYEDFALSKKERTTFNTQIYDDIKRKNLEDKIVFKCHLNELFHNELKDEVEDVNLEILLDCLDDEDDYLVEYIDNDRNSIGLSSLDSFEINFKDNFYEYSDVQDIQKLLDDIYDLISQSEVYYSKYDDIIDLLKSSDTQLSKVASNLCLNKDAVLDKLSLLQEECDIDTVKELDFSLDNHIRFYDSFKNKITIKFLNTELDPINYGYDTIKIELNINDEDKVIGSINISYGGVDLDCDGHPSNDATGESIDFNFDEIKSTLKRMINEYKQFYSKHERMIKKIEA